MCLKRLKLIIRLKPSFFFLIFFIISLLILILTEGPFRVKITTSSLADLIPSDILLDDIWYGVYYQNRFVGFSHFYLRVQEAESGGGYLLSNSTDLKLPVLNTTQKISIDSDMILKKNYKLKKAVIRFNSQHYILKGTIEHDRGADYLLKVSTPSQDYQRQITLGNEYVTSLLSPLSLSYLPKKNNTSLTLYDPFFERKVEVQFRDLAKERISIDGRDFESRVVEMEIDGIKGKLYLDEKSRVVKKEIFDFSFVKEQPLSIFKKNDSMVNKDISVTFGIKAGHIPDPDNLSYIKIKIDGIEPDQIPQDHTQKLLVEGDDIYLEIHKIEANKKTLNLPINEIQFKQYLRETDFIKTNDPAVKDIVSSIINKESDPLVITKKLSSWINTNIDKVPTMSIPNTSDVLLMKQGDCGELSALLVGFLRSLGIPSYTNIGLVYMNGQFYYHAWVSVYIGYWIDTDIALNQFIADPTHIKLLKGLENQYKLANFFNKLKIDVVEYK